MHMCDCNRRLGWSNAVAVWRISYPFELYGVPQTFDEARLVSKYISDAIMKLAWASLRASTRHAGAHSLVSWQLGSITPPLFRNANNESAAAPARFLLAQNGETDNAYSP
jgi:hypothetical protein